MSFQNDPIVYSVLLILNVSLKEFGKILFSQLKSKAVVQRSVQACD